MPNYDRIDSPIMDPPMSQPLHRLLTRLKLKWQALMAALRYMSVFPRWRKAQSVDEQSLYENKTNAVFLYVSRLARGKVVANPIFGVIQPYPPTDPPSLLKARHKRA